MITEKGQAMKPKLSILTSCTAGKVIDAEEENLCYDLYYNDPKSWMEKTEELRKEGKAIKAGALYSGVNADNAQRLKEVLEDKYDVTHYIFSAAYGIVNANTLLPGYSCTFSGMSEFDRIYLDEFTDWVKVTNQDTLPDGSLICLPNSYLKAFKRLDNGTHHILPVDNRGRQKLACPSIHAALLWFMEVAEEGMALGWEIDQWPILSEILLEEENDVD